MLRKKCKKCKHFKKNSNYCSWLVAYMKPNEKACDSYKNGTLPEHISIYRNKECSWKSVYIRKNTYEKNFFFRIRLVPMNKNLIKPRFFASINLGILNFHRNNSHWGFGIGFGKTHYTLTMQL